MIIKLLQDEVIDGKLRVKGEVVRVRNFDGECKLIKQDKKERMKKVKEIKPKKDGKAK
jgi:hypothetical protein